MFIVLLLGLSLALVIPTTIGVILFPRRRHLITSAAITAGGTTALFGILAIFFQKAYFQNPTSPMSLVLVVTFLVTFVISLKKAGS